MESLRIEELRIGNIAYDDEMTIGTIARVESQEYNDYNGSDTQLVTMLIDGGYYLTDRVFGIPLSPAILEKCGLQFDGLTYRNKSDLVVSGDFTWVGIYIPRNDEDVTLDCPEYLHQLQNLYYSLTGTELTITL